MDDKPRLIEVAFPLKQASLASVHEKNVRHGHISTLHIWPARRPLAACRAALLATLLPDPSDAEKRRDLLAKIGGNTTTKAVEETDDEGNTVVEDKQVVEGGILAWGQEDDKLVNELREEVRRFYGGNAPKLLDPFAGGGAIPFEAMRLGCEVTASDLSPVAWFILKCTLEYPQRFAEKKWPLPDFVREWPDFVEDFLTGKVKKRKANRKSHFSDPRQLALTELPAADLAWHVRAWGRWVLERTTPLGDVFRCSRRFGSVEKKGDASLFFPSPRKISRVSTFTFFKNRI
jgi:putative DNA methylase